MRQNPLRHDPRSSRAAFQHPAGQPAAQPRRSGPRAATGPALWAPAHRRGFRHGRWDRRSPACRRRQPDWHAFRRNRARPAPRSAPAPPHRSRRGPPLRRACGAGAARHYGAPDAGQSHQQRPAPQWPPPATGCARALAPACRGPTVRAHRPSMPLPPRDHGQSPAPRRSARRESGREAFHRPWFSACPAQFPLTGFARFWPNRPKSLRCPCRSAHA